MGNDVGIRQPNLNVEAFEGPSPLGHVASEWVKILVKKHILNQDMPVNVLFNNTVARQAFASAVANKFGGILTGIGNIDTNVDMATLGLRIYNVTDGQQSINSGDLEGYLNQAIANFRANAKPASTQVGKLAKGSNPPAIKS